MTLTPSIRSERPADHAAIRHLIDAAFASAAHASGAEAGIVDKLRNAGQLSLSFVAETADGIVGHIAFSPVCIGGAACGWFGLAPLSVLPAAHGQGIGRALVDQQRQAPGQLTLYQLHRVVCLPGFAIIPPDRR